MQIKKINGFWVPSNDVHIGDWQDGKSFTQNKCLEKFITHCKSKNLKFNHVLDIGAWVGTWTVAMNTLCGRIVAFEPDPVHYECLTKNVPEDVETHQLAVGNDSKMIALSDDDFTQAKRVVGDGSIPMVTVDGLGLSTVGFTNPISQPVRVFLKNLHGVIGRAAVENQVFQVGVILA